MRILCDVTLKKESEDHSLFTLAGTSDPGAAVIKLVVNKDTEDYRILAQAVENNKPVAVEITAN